MSVEQMNDLHIVRRILRALNPEYRILASEDLEPGQSVLDVEKKTIEVGETPDVMLAVSSLLFQVGHLLLKEKPVYRMFFGNGIREWPGTDEQLIDRLAFLGTKADAEAIRWASDVIQLHWSLPAEKAQSLIVQHAWTQDEWKEYFSAA